MTPFHDLLTTLAKLRDGKTLVARRRHHNAAIDALNMLTAEKNAQIKELTDALESMRDEAGHIDACGNGGEDAENCSPLCNKVDAALRLVGRPP